MLAKAVECGIYRPDTPQPTCDSEFNTLFQSNNYSNYTIQDIDIDIDIMGLFSSSDPIKQQEKMLAREEKNEEKSLKQAVKDLAHAEKEEHKALKVSPPTLGFPLSPVFPVSEKSRG
jgi:hypothetical protein